MRKTIQLIVVCLFGVMLSACNLPGTTLNSATPTSEQQVIPATLTPPPADATAVPATATALPPTVTATLAVPTQPTGPAVILDQVRMVSPTDGWGWAFKNSGPNQLLRTADGGQTWKDVSPQGDYVYYTSFFLNSQAAWLGFYNSGTNTGGMLHTTDGGGTWTNLPPSDAIQGETAMVSFTTLNDGLAETAGVGAGNAYLNYYQTHDGGSTWSPILIVPPNPEDGLPPGTVHLCNICGDQLYYDPARVMISHGTMANEPTPTIDISISTDLGKTWKKQQLPLPDPKYAGGAIAPLASAFFGMDGFLPINIIKYNQDGTLGFSILAVYVTHDGGQTWQISPAILDNKKAQISAVQILSSSVAFVRCGKNLCKTSDGFQTWQTLPESLNFDQAAGGPDYVNQFSFIDPANGWAISGDSGATTLWKTTDGGTSWTKLSPTLAQ